MKPTKLTRQDVLRRAQAVGLKFSIEKRGGRWCVLATSDGAAQPIEVGAKDTYDAARGFVAEMSRQANAMLPGIVAQAQDTEAPL